MFTGIIEEIGEIISIRKQGDFAQLAIRANHILQDVKLGDSIAVNGVCLTVTQFSPSHFCADVMSETLARTTLGELQANSAVNLERAMSANGRFGGHIVSGHIDGIGKIIAITPANNSVWFKIQTTPAIMRYIIQKGSITIDGISLTVVDCEQDYFSVSIIPHTLSETILGIKKVGQKVNLENDVIGKYVEKLLQPASSSPSSTITEEFLRKVGF
ncbi:riboflavin synthase [Ursidibacter arcticus]|uniref:riboflavin synthase n=1 Tax=Ursidibacter arcticus TaxID=1524965 RepID=UPI0012FBAB68|nr:riboflavin synthase [Ursidibacter arcticus]KAE9536563.1 riboflavin synthase subunit alpha [Ursidibacter arcticus]